MKQQGQKLDLVIKMMLTEARAFEKRKRIVPKSPLSPKTSSPREVSKECDFALNDEYLNIVSTPHFAHDLSLS